MNSACSFVLIMITDPSFLPGGHDLRNEMNPDWEPYSPKMRLENLREISSRFQVAFVKGDLCVQLNGGSHVQPIRWLWKDAEGNSVTPERMSKEQFCEQVRLLLMCFAP